MRSFFFKYLSKIDATLKKKSIFKQLAADFKPLQINEGGLF